MSPLELLNRLPKNLRTTKSRVLISLYCCGGLDRSSAVQTQDLAQLFSTHFRKADRPNNLAKEMRRAEPSVSCVSVGGGKLKWYITETGWKFLADSLALGPPEAASSSGVGYDFDIAIVCALPAPELSAVLKQFGGESAWAEVPSQGWSHRYRQTVQKRLFRESCG